MEQDPRREIIEARRQLVAQRQLIIKGLSHGYTRGQSEAHIDMLIKVQSAIDIIDRVSKEAAEA